MKSIFYNGNIITMEKEMTANAIMIEDGIIKKVGDICIDEVSDDVQHIDLKGKTLLPAFLDPHSHFTGTASSLLQVQLGECVSIDELQERLKSYIKSKQLQEGSWVTGSGYDHNNFKGKAHPTRQELDEVSNDIPILIIHKSGHAGVFNTKGLEVLGVTVDTVAPEGGKIGKKDNELTGYMEETAFIEYMQKVDMPGMETLFAALSEAQMKYLSNGICTVQEGFMPSQMIDMYKPLLANKSLKVDIVAYADKNSAEKIVDNFKSSKMQYDNNFKIGGYKIFLDGSPQARTAWMKTPYAGSDDYCGYGTMKFEEVCDAIRAASSKKMQILAHCNGDAAAQQYIDAIRTVEKEGYDVKSLRPVMIHAQFLDLDQLDDVKALGILPSFFVAHVYYWGDIHIENFGLDRASRISPAASALKHGISYTFHQDAPVIEPNMLETIWCAVNRVTKNGVILGEDEKISVVDALKAVTINAAYQYFEEDSKGSLKEGKKADFVILDKNPLDVPVNEIRDIKVMETIKGGVTLYKR